MKNVKGLLLFCCLSLGLHQSASAQSVREYMSEGQNLVKRGLPKRNNKPSLSLADVSAGLREALTVGAKNATGKVSVHDGFFGNALIKLPMPAEAKKVETTLREFGMGQYVDDAVLSMNRAAENASGKAIDIFVSAVKNMTIEDAMKILEGPNDAATQYLKLKTMVSLKSAFKPVVSASLDKVNATKYWSELFNAYNALPTTFNKVNPDLVDYVTEKALAGLFLYIADEEAKIRLNPAARVTDLLKRVFEKH